jgi:hypothetical protein
MRPVHGLALLSGWLVALQAGTAAADAVDMNLKKTHVRTVAGTTTLLGPWTEVFSPTTVTCPDEIGTCVVRIEVTSLFSLIEPGSAAAMRARVDGIAVSPSLVEVDSTSTSDRSNSRTFTWLKTGLATGDHVVRVDFGLTGGGAPAQAGPRSVTIEVYKIPPHISLP